MFKQKIEKKNINTFLEKFTIFFFNKKNIMNFWEIQEKRFFFFAQKKKCTKKNVMIFWKIQGKSFFCTKKNAQKKCNEFLGNLGKKFFFFCAKKNAEKKM